MTRKRFLFADRKPDMIINVFCCDSWRTSGARCRNRRSGKRVDHRDVDESSSVADAKTISPELQSFSKPARGLFSLLEMNGLAVGGSRGQDSGECVMPAEPSGSLAS